MRTRLLPLVALIATLEACGNDGPPEPEPLSGTCEAAWQPVTEVMDLDLSSGLVYRDGLLYFGLAFEAGEIRAVRVSDGTQTTIAPTATFVLWVEGEQLFFESGQLGTQFFSVPVAGGTPTLVGDGTAGRSEPGIAQLRSHVLSQTDFFWAEAGRPLPTAPATVWRLPRAGGPPVELARFTELVAETNTALFFQGAALAPEGLVLGENWGLAKLVPLDGGPPRTLTAPDVENRVLDISFAGVDANGVYWSVTKQGSAEGDARELVISPADGGPVKSLWATTPPYSFIQAVWPDGLGGLIVTGSQRFAGESISRTTIRSLDANGNSQLLGCSQIPSGSARIQESPAITPDAVYFIIWNNDTPTRMQIVGVPRTPPAAAAVHPTLD